MLCQACHKRNARVHETSFDTRTPGSRVERHLCEVCAGLKTEREVEEERAAFQLAAEKRREAQADLLQQIHSALFSAHFDSNQKQVLCCGTATCDSWNMHLILLRSGLPDVDPLQPWRQPGEGGKKHIARQVLGYDVRLICWSADPTQLMMNIFEPFPAAGARVDVAQGLLFVDRERDLFPDPFQSHSFCQFAASLLMNCDVVARKEFIFHSRKPQWMLDALNGNGRPSL